MRGLTPCLLGLLSLLMISCGGGSGGSKTTKTRTAAAVFSVEWPEASRFIHNRATKVKLVVFRGDTLAISGQGETARPGNGTTSQIKLNELPADESLKIAASAEDASGRVLSSAIQYSTLKPGANALTFTLASVVTTVEITPGSPTVAVGGTLNLSAVGKNGTATVLSDTSDFDWSSSAPLVATVDSTGKVVGIADGTATITVREAGNDATGLTATIQIKVGSGETVNYQITDLGTLGGDNCFATALTNDGQVVGYSDTSSQSHVFLWSGGSMTDLSYLGYNSQGYGLDVTSVAVNKFGRVVASFYDSHAVNGNGWVSLAFPPATGDPITSIIPHRGLRVFSVNDNGDMAGIVFAPYNFRLIAHPVIWINGAEVDLSRDLGLNEGDGGIAVSITSSGKVLAYIQDPVLGGASGRAFIWQNGQVVTSVSQLNPTAITDDGRIVGHYAPDVSSYLRAARWADGVKTDLPGLGTLGSQALCINSHGYIGGWYVSADGDRRAFIFDGLSSKDLNTLSPIPGWRISEVVAINDQGQVLCHAQQSSPTSTTTKSFLLTPRR